MAPAVDQHQRAVGAQVAQVQLVQPGLAERAICPVAARGLRTVARTAQRGHAQQEIGQVGIARFLDAGRVKRNNRVWRLVIGAGDARAGNDDSRFVCRQRRHGYGIGALRHGVGALRKCTGWNQCGACPQQGLRTPGNRHEFPPCLRQAAPLSKYPVMR